MRGNPTTDPLAILAPDAVAVDTVATASLLQWKLLQAGPWRSMDVPPVRREVLLACSWPPWFTYAVWSWARRLEWTESEGDGRAKIGATNVELLVCFVLETGVIPPTSLNKARTADSAPRRFLEPVCLRNLKQNLVAAVRQMERLCGFPIWPRKRRKCFALRSLGRQEACHGTCLRPKFPQLDVMGEMLQKVVRQSSAVPLLQYAAGYVGPVWAWADVQRHWTLTSTAARNTLARALRRG